MPPVNIHIYPFLEKLTIIIKQVDDIPSIGNEL